MVENGGSVNSDTRVPAPVVMVLKLVQIKIPFGFLQSSPQILVERVKPFFFEKHVFVRHTNEQPLKKTWLSLTRSYPFGGE